MGLLDQWNKPSENIEDQIRNAISNGNTIRISYQNFNGENSSRILSKLEYNNEFESEGYSNDHIKAYCHLREEDRTFKISRIISVEILE